MLQSCSHWELRKGVHLAGVGLGTLVVRRIERRDGCSKDFGSDSLFRVGGYIKSGIGHGDLCVSSTCSCTQF